MIHAPALIRHGADALAFARPRLLLREHMAVALWGGTAGVWGVLGVVALLFALANLLPRFDRRRDRRRRPL